MAQALVEAKPRIDHANAKAQWTQREKKKRKEKKKRMSRCEHSHRYTWVRTNVERSHGRGTQGIGEIWGKSGGKNKR